MPHFSLLLAVLLFSGCIYYDPYAPGSPYGYYPPRYYHRHHPRREEDQPVETEPDGSPTTPPDQSGPPVTKELPETDSKVQTPPPPPPNPEKSKDVPTAARGSKPGRVKNPFHPDQELDVTGLPSGSLAKDPTTGKIFKLP